MELREAIAEFLLSGVQAGWSQGTHTQYRWHLNRWAAWLAAPTTPDVQPLSQLAELDKHRLRQWGASLHTVWQPATQRAAITAVKSFLAWVRHEKLLPKKVAKQLRKALAAPRVKKRRQRTIQAAEVAALLRQTQLLVEQGVGEAAAMQLSLRNAALVSLLYDSYVRAKELCGLKLTDVDLTQRQIVVLGKGGDEGVAHFSAETAARLRAWLAVRTAAPGVAAVFVSVGGQTPGQPLHPRGLRAILSRLAQRAGVPHLTTHAFRRGAARQAIRLGAPTRLVQEYGRWSNVDMVEVYTRDLDAADLYDQYSPIHSLHLDEHPAAAGAPTAGAPTDGAPTDAAPTDGAPPPNGAATAAQPRAPQAAPTPAGAPAGQPAPAGAPSPQAAAADVSAPADAAPADAAPAPRPPVKP